MNTETYPRVNETGETVWACCVSAIGPTCQHVATPPVGWSEVFETPAGERISYVEHGASALASPPHLQGWVCQRVDRLIEYTRWIYRPIEGK